MNEIQPKIKKPKGPIRTEAVVPIAVVAVTFYIYFHFFFDMNLRSAFEWAGYQAMGAEVNIASLKTDFIGGTFRMQGIEVTDSSKPSHNLFQIGDIRFGVKWDGLLRARFIVDEMAVEKIEIANPRKKAGKVKPPEPPPAAEKTASEPSQTSAPAPDKKSEVATKVEKAADKALDKVEDKYEGNMIGDAAAMLGGKSSGEQVGNIEQSLGSKAKIKEFEILLAQKQKSWQEKLKALPPTAEIQALGTRLGQVKTKDFKTPQELQNSLQQIDAILKEGDAKFKLIQSTTNEINADIQLVDKQYKDLNAQIQTDINNLQARFKLPKLDASSMAKAMFMQYLTPYMNTLNKYKAMADKYVPPGIKKKFGGPSAQTTTFKPHPRAKGVSYEFGKPKAYPMFWIKKISVSSEAGASANAGDVSGKITDITSNQDLTGKPTVAAIDGSFPGVGLMGMVSRLVIDSTKEPSHVNFKFDIGSYNISGRSVVDSPDVKIGFNKANGSLQTRGELIGLKQLDYRLDNNFKNVAYDISASTPVATEVLTGIFQGIPVVTLEAYGKGELPNFPLNINSNLGPALQKGFEKQLQKKVDEARKRLEAQIHEAIGKEKAKIDAQYTQIKSQVEGESKKLMDQINGQKAQGEAKINQAKKDAEDQAKRALGNDAQKKVDELKKKLGF